jgi:AcrR family transcriptional regulator
MPVKPTRKRNLSPERIVAAAVELADAEGLEAVSMSRVAELLGFTAMALYRHVADKDELLLLMFDAAAGPPPEPGDGDWRAGLDHWSRALLARLERHPWAIRIPITGPPSTLNRLGWFDHGLRALESTALSEAEKAATILLLNGHVFWWARLSTDLRDVEPADFAALQDALAGALDAGQLPALQRALQAGVFTDEHDDFGFGLDRILDGVERRV